MLELSGNEGKGESRNLLHYSVVNKELKHRRLYLSYTMGIHSFCPEEQAVSHDVRLLAVRLFEGVPFWGLGHWGQASGKASTGHNSQW